MIASILTIAFVGYSHAVSVDGMLYNPSHKIQNGCENAKVKLRFTFTGGLLDEISWANVKEKADYNHLLTQVIVRIVHADDAASKGDRETFKKMCQSLLDDVNNIHNVDSYPQYNSLIPKAQAAFPSAIAAADRGADIKVLFDTMSKDFALAVREANFK